MLCSSSGHSTDCEPAEEEEEPQESDNEGSDVGDKSAGEQCDGEPASSEKGRIRTKKTAVMSSQTRHQPQVVILQSGKEKEIARSECSKK